MYNYYIQSLTSTPKSLGLKYRASRHIDYKLVVVGEEGLVGTEVGGSGGRGVRHPFVLTLYME